MCVFSSSNERACKTNNAGGYMPFGHSFVKRKKKDFTDTE